MITRYKLTCPAIYLHRAAGGGQRIRVMGPRKALGALALGDSTADPHWFLCKRRPSWRIVQVNVLFLSCLIITPSDLVERGDLNKPN